MAQQPLKSLQSRWRRPGLSAAHQAGSTHRCARAALELSRAREVTGSVTGSSRAAARPALGHRVRHRVFQGRSSPSAMTKPFSACVSVTLDARRELRGTARAGRLSAPLG